MTIYVTTGWVHPADNTTPMIVQLRTDVPLVYDTIVTADGVTRPASSASCTLMGEVLEFDLAAELLDQLQLSTYQPSAPVTVTLPDSHRFPVPFHGYVRFEVSNSWRGYYEDFRLVFYRLVEAQ